MDEYDYSFQLPLLILLRRNLGHGGQSSWHRTHMSRRKGTRTHIGIRSLTQPGCDVTNCNTITTSLSERMGRSRSINRCAEMHPWTSAAPWPRTWPREGPDMYSRYEIADLCDKSRVTAPRVDYTTCTKRLKCHRPHCSSSSVLLDGMGLGRQSPCSR